MSRSDEILAIIISELKEKYSLSKVITPQSRLYHDLGLRGIDAEEFLGSVFRKFDVDPAGFTMADYFKGEYYSPFDFLNYVFGHVDKSKKPLTVIHLVNVCLQRKWFEPYS